MTQGVNVLRNTLAAHHASPQNRIFKVSAPPPSRRNFRHNLNRSRGALALARFRWFPLLIVVCFTATTAFSTTFPLKSSSSNTYINNNGLPSKQTPLAEGSSRVLEETASKSKTKNIPAEENLNAKPTGSTNSNLVPPIEPHDDDEDKTALNDTEEDKMETVDDNKFKERIQSSMRTVQNWENIEWLKECREDVIPWDDLRNATGPYSRPDHDRLLADDSNALFLQRLCRWFPKFMTWVNAPPCVKCGCKECEMKTVRGPETEEENEGNAKRVEGM